MVSNAIGMLGICGSREEGLLPREKRHLLLDYNEYESDLRFDCVQVHRQMKRLSDRRPAARKTGKAQIELMNQQRKL